MRRRVGRVRVATECDPNRRRRSSPPSLPQLQDAGDQGHASTSTPTKDQNGLDIRIDGTPQALADVQEDRRRPAVQRRAANPTSSDGPPGPPYRVAPSPLCGRPSPVGGHPLRNARRRNQRRDRQTAGAPGAATAAQHLHVSAAQLHCSRTVPGRHRTAESYVVRQRRKTWRPGCSICEPPRLAALAMTAAAAGACSFASAAAPPPPRAASSAPTRPERIKDRYIVVLKDGSPTTSRRPATSAARRARFGGTVQDEYGAAVRGFTAT